MAQDAIRECGFRPRKPLKRARFAGAVACTHKRDPTRLHEWRDLIAQTPEAGRFAAGCRAPRIAPPAPPQTSGVIRIRWPGEAWSILAALPREIATDMFA
jgi:hypothetical protein